MEHKLERIRPKSQPHPHTANVCRNDYGVPIPILNTNLSSMSYVNQRRNCALIPPSFFLPYHGRHDAPPVMNSSGYLLTQVDNFRRRQDRLRPHFVYTAPTLVILSNDCPNVPTPDFQITLYKLPRKIQFCYSIHCRILPNIVFVH